MKLVILDAGHNEYVSGKQAPDKSMREWEFNDDMQNRISKMLASYPEIKVYLTNPNPEGKNEIGLAKRAVLANDYWRKQGKPDALFISLHANAFGVWTTANGCETYHATNASTKSKVAAKVMNDEIHATLKSLNPTSVNRGVKKENFTVIYKAAMPSILVEYAFYTNKTDLAILKNNRQELAEATVRAICKYFNIEYIQPNKINAYVKITANVLNVRKGPGTNYEITTQVKKGQAFTIVETQGNWGKLKSGVGWINLGYTEKIK